MLVKLIFFSVRSKSFPLKLFNVKQLKNGTKTYGNQLSFTYLLLKFKNKSAVPSVYIGTDYDVIENMTSLLT